MNRSNAVGAALLVVGLLLGGLIVERAGAQARTTKIRSWPPEPQDIVQLRGASVGLDDGDMFTVFTVPNDRWLVLTEPAVGGYGEYDPTTGNFLSVSNQYFSIVADSRGVSRTILNPIEFPALGSNNLPTGGSVDSRFYPTTSGPSQLASVVGIALEPGTALKIRYANSLDVKGDNLQAHAQWNLIGYLTDR
ncbi:MAG: hypothetical protein JNL90_02735 [Planctomycetes bacterium]|nr:hypothetical protein [Planctomycetota bacterium]